jgi:hypothetical protein
MAMWSSFLPAQFFTRQVCFYPPRQAVLPTGLSCTARRTTAGPGSKPGPKPGPTVARCEGGAEEIEEMQTRGPKAPRHQNFRC